MTDPFAAHPDLKSKIQPAEGSFWRDFSVEKLIPVLEANNVEGGWWHPPAANAANHRATFADRPHGDLWVFAYGSLMWDPGIDFAEVRRAWAPNHARRFILRDIYGGRGTRAPGLMAALDQGNGCAGLAFRIDAASVLEETAILWRREMLAPCYFPDFIPIDIDGTRQEALTFVADPDAELIDTQIRRDEQIEFLLTGKGFLGTSFAYLENVIDHLHDMGIPDPELDDLFAAVSARQNANT